MRALKQLTVSLLVAGATSLPAMAQDVVVFGDSLSDVGQTNWWRKASYAKADGSPNQLWSEVFAQHWGSTLTASSAGGTDWAHSGGTLVSTNASKETGAQSARVKGQNVVSAQVDGYIAAGVKPTAHHVLWAGGNDMRGVLERAVASENPIETVKLGVTEVADAAGEAWSKLHSAGVDTVFMPDVPNIALTPAFFLVGIASQTRGYYSVSDLVDYYNEYVERAARVKPEVLQDVNAFRHYFFENFLTGYRAWFMSPEEANAKYDELIPQASLATKLLNQSITDKVNAVGGNIIRVPLAALLDDVIQNPTRYGFSDSVRFACEDSVARVCGLSEPGQRQAHPDADAMLFADTFHPGPKLHALASDFMVSLVEAPRALGAMDVNVLANDARLTNALLREVEGLGRQSFEVGHLTGLVNATATTKNDSGSFHVGGTYRVNERWSTGLLLGRTWTKTKDATVTVKNQSTGAVGSVRFDVLPQAYVGALLSAQTHKLETDRELMLGTYTVKQTGSTDALTFGAGAFAGVDGNLGRFDWGLRGSVVATTGSRRALTEDVNHFTRLTLEKSTVKNVEAKVGAVASLPMETVTPFLRVDWAHNTHATTDVGVELNGSRYVVQSPVGVGNQADVGLGLLWTPTKGAVSLRLEATKRFQGAHDEGLGLNARLAVRF